MILDTLIRWRTAILGFVLAAASALPALLGAPEILAIVPPEWRPYIIAAGFVAMYLTRHRPATRAHDPEVQVAKAIEATPGPTTVVVASTAGGEPTAVVNA